MPRPSIEPSDQTTPTLLTNLPRSPGGNLMSQTEGIPGDRLQEEEEGDNHLTHQDRHRAAEAEEEEEEEEEEEAGGHSHCPGKHLPNLLKNS